MNPHSEKQSTYSVWPVEILNYNIAPWLATKPYWMMLSLIIPGPKAVSEQKFDVFLQPLLDELLELWNPGVQTKDAARQHNEEFFVLRAMLLFTIHDFPGYGLVAGCTTKGAKRCPICGKNTKTRRSRYLKKIIYGHAHRKWLDELHHWRFREDLFDNTEEHDT
jgi:hypothetical protein